MLEFIALGMVMDGPLTGYDIKKYIETGIGTFYKASYGSLYPLLKRLADRGLLAVTEEQQGSRQKKYYQITAQGKTEFLEWLRSPIDFSDNTDNQLAKIYFFDRLPEDERKEQLAEYELSCSEYLKKLKSLLKKYEQMENKACFYYKLSTLYYGIAVMQTTIGWCRQIRAQDDLSELIH